MDVSGAYRAVTIPRRTICMGLRLEEYSAGHECLLDAFLSPFVNDHAEEPPTFNDLVLAVFICSQKWQDAKNSLESGFARLLIRFWGWRARKLNLAKEAMRFQEYINAGRATPDEIVYTFVPSNATFSSPSVHRTKIFLMQETGMTEEAFLNRPLALSNADFCTIQELYGRMGAMSDSDRALFKAAKGSE